MMLIVWVVAVSVAAAVVGPRVARRPGVGDDVVLALLVAFGALAAQSFGIASALFMYAGLGLVRDG
jgi:hypothetical protein